MNHSLFLFHFFIVLFLTPTVFSFTSNTISYSEYASEAIPSGLIISRYPFLEPVTSHFTGGHILFDQDFPLLRSIVFKPTQNFFKTNISGTYKIQARLFFLLPNIHHFPSNFTQERSEHNLVFLLNGFWSISTKKLCMVGSARWFSKEGNPLKLDVVLKLKLGQLVDFNSSLVSGTLESLSSRHESNYFDPISMLGFPRVSPFKYNYTLVSNQEFKTKIQHDSVISMNSLEICSIFNKKFTTYRLEYPSNCKNCSLFGQDSSFLPSFVSLFGIQCSPNFRKLRLLFEFKDRRYIPKDQSFNPEISLIGEGTWNETEHELYIIACHISNQSDPLGSARVGDCSMRLTLWFPEIRSIKKTHTTEGQIWTTKITDALGSFRKAKLQSVDHSPENYARKYEYTQMEKVRRICPKRKLVRGKYKSGYYGFHMAVKHKNMDSTGYAVPIFVGNRVFDLYTIVNPNFNQFPVDDILTSSYNSRLNISFEISFKLNISSILRNGILSLNLSSNKNRVDITAEGFYDVDSGHICMVGCRILNSNFTSFDCEIVVRFQYPEGNGSFMKGRIESLRDKNDVLYFEHLDIFSLTYTKSEAREEIWRIDIEIIMVLISYTLACVFIARQLFHLRKKPEMVNLISVVMMLILTFMVPLVLNFEVIFSSTRNQQNIPAGGSGGWIEVDEVVVTIVTMVAFILLFRLLQLTWTAKKNHRIPEIRTFILSLSMILLTGSVMLLVNWRNNSYTIDLRSYAGLIVDGFLFPQLILNIFQFSKGNALSYSFYVGTTLVRLFPHAYDLYRGPECITYQIDRFYIYANPREDFYSPLWDIVIIFGGIVLAVIVFLQQRFGGRFMFPKRFRESVEYETVPVSSNE